MTDPLILFAIVAFIGIATPGPTMLLALSNGSRLGVRAALPGMAGAVLADFVFVSAVAVGFGALLAASESLFAAVKWLGVGYLAYLGIRLLRSRGTLQLPADGVAPGSPSPRAVFMRSLAVSLTNPKGYLFFSAFFPQFISAQQPQLPQYAVLAIVFASINFAVMLFYAAAGAQAIRVLKARGILWLDRACGGAMLTLAGSLALYRKSA